MSSVLKVDRIQSDTGTVNVASKIEFPVGSAAAPSIFPTGDTNTGIFFPAADTIAFAEGGAEAMRIDSSGQLLLGTTSNLSTNRRELVLQSANGSLLNLGINGAVDSFQFICDTGPNALIVNKSNTPMIFYTNNTERLRIDSAGALILAGSTAQKATGTTWSNPSDQRLKDNIRDYNKGLAELMQVRVREWEYNGKGGTIEGTKGLGVVADEVMTVLPDTVENYEAKLNADDEEVTAIKKFDATEITWLLVKTVQELKAITDTQAQTISALEARIAALESQ